MSLLQDYNTAPSPAVGISGRHSAQLISAPQQPLRSGAPWFACRVGQFQDVCVPRISHFPCQKVEVSSICARDWQTLPLAMHS
eukprot:1141016-Pelagomonas_calceolata.AAC.1